MPLRRLLFILIALLATFPALAGKPTGAKGPDPDAILRDLYKAHNAQAGPFAQRKNRKLVERYFTKELAGMIVKDAVQADGDAGAYGFDPLYASQDPQVEHFKIGTVQWGGLKKRDDDPDDEGFALVALTFKDSGKWREMRFGFEVQADKTWRISDIHYPDGPSLLSILREAYPG